MRNFHLTMFFSVNFPSFIRRRMRWMDERTEIVVFGCCVCVNFRFTLCFVYVLIERQGFIKDTFWENL